jgi:ATP-dependent Clp protease adaptor protein ClpS
VVGLYAAGLLARCPYRHHALCRSGHALFFNPELRYIAAMHDSILIPRLAAGQNPFYARSPAMRLGTRGMADHDSGDGDKGNGQIGLATRARAKPKKPSQFKVLLLNDDYTPMEFVVMVLKRFFNMDLEQATQVMLHVHQKGVGVCGIFPYEIAETKVNQVMDAARAAQHPLQCTLEKA